MHFVTIPVFDSGAAQAELNRFLAAHRVLAVERQLIADGAGSAWAVCVSYVDRPAARAAGDVSATAQKITAGAGDPAGDRDVCRRAPSAAAEAAADPAVRPRRVVPRLSGRPVVASALAASASALCGCAQRARGGLRRGDAGGA